MMMTKVEIEVPEAMTPYIVEADRQSTLRRNALLLYPLVYDRKMSHGRAAEILGIHKLDLIELMPSLRRPAHLLRNTRNLNSLLSHGQLQRVSIAAI